jgi:hypothetical protein
MQDVFTGIYKHNLWSGRQSRSGTGSDFEETKKIRRSLPKLFDRLKIESLVDIPCGDFNWFQDMPIKFKYMGLDIVEVLIEDNKVKYPELHWGVADITQHDLPKVDLIFTRDCLGHLSNENIHKSVANIKRAKPKYLVATHWPAIFGGPINIPDGSWRPINMDKFLDDDFELIELLPEDMEDKYLGVWRLR